MAQRRHGNAAATHKRITLIIFFLSILMPLRFLVSYDARSAEAVIVVTPESMKLSRRSSSNVVVPPRINAVLYVTTHFSDVHIRYFHCCWPILVQQSPLIQKLHVIVAATNFTTVAQEELDYLQKVLFVHNPSYRFMTPSHASHLSHCEPFRVGAPPRRRNPHRKVPVNYKQCLANYGVSFGWPAVQPYDWMIRLNPDVLLRQSTWFMESMQNTSVDALLIDCGEGTRQIHTDFWAVRPAVVTMSMGQNNNNKNNNITGAPFQNMSRIRNHLNHERTAFHQFLPILKANRQAWVPGMEPSQGVCRARGSRAPILHDHTSCFEGEGICHDLDGWDVSE